MTVITQFDTDVAGKRASAATKPNGPRGRFAT